MATIVSSFFKESAAARKWVASYVALRPASVATAYSNVPKTKIKLIVPITDPVFNEKALAEARSVCAPDFEVDLSEITKGTKYIESRSAEYYNSENIISIVQQAVKDGYRGVFIFCFGSPAVPCIREMFDIPILGGFEPAILTAMNLAQTFSIVTVEARVVSMLRELARVLGVTSSMVSIRVIDIPVLGLDDENVLFAQLYKESEAAIKKDGAECIVLGCTGMLDIAHKIQSALAASNLPVPVIDPTIAAMGTLQTLIRGGYTQSRRTYWKYPAPPQANASTST